MAEAPSRTQPKPPPAPRKTRVPPRELEVEWARSHGIPPEHAEFPKFVDHFRSSGDVKADWLATWRNWVRRAPEFAPRRPAVGAYGAPVQTRLLPEDEAEQKRRQREADADFNRRELERLEARKRGQQGD